MPRPEVCRNLRRELSIDTEFSIDIDELTHIENQKAQPGQGIAPQIIQSGLALGCGGVSH
jgi:hypothetical protein